MADTSVCRASFRKRIPVSYLFLVVAVASSIFAQRALAEATERIRTESLPVASPLAPEIFWFSTPANLPDEKTIEIRLHHALGITLSPRSNVPPPHGSTQNKGTLSTSLRSAVERVSDSTGRRIEFRRGDLILNVSDTLYWRLDEPEITYLIRF